MAHPHQPRYPPGMNESDKRIRRSTLRLVAASLALGFLIGFGVGVAVTYHSISRVVVVTLDSGIEV